jgi:group II intron reverse transcriptase/maturase
MSHAPTWKGMSPGLLKVAESAREDPRMQFRTLAHLIDERLLDESYERIRPNAAAGVDGVTKAEYGRELAANLRGLRERMKAGQYRHQPVLRVQIPKGGGKTRPIGLSTVEDKVVQNALTRVLEAIYEQDFLDCSYGFRRERSAHEALRALDAAGVRGELNWVLEADIQSFFDSLDRAKLMEMLQRRIADRAVLRLISKCLHAGVLDGEEYTEPSEGTVQGSSLSPMLGNVYLHDALDVWFAEEVKPNLNGPACLIRYADDFIMGFAREDDARATMEKLTEQLAAYGLTLHPDKTRVLPFARPSRDQPGGKGPGTFDFLGFTVYWRKTRGGRWGLGYRTRKARFQRAVAALTEHCRRHRHEPVKEQHAALCRRIRGHFNYFGVNSNGPSLCRLLWHAERAWLKWLRRRSQRSRLTWERYRKMLKRFPLPAPTIRVQVWS